MSLGTIPDTRPHLEDGERPPIDWIGYLFVACFAVPFLVFNVGPVIFGTYVAFTEWSIIGTPRWVGLENFREGFSDEWVWVAFRNVFFYALIIVPGVTVLGLTFALFVNRSYPLAGLARTLFFAPHVVSATVIGLVWVWILDTQFGLVNNLLGTIGIRNIPWLTSTDWALIGVSIASIWWDLGLAFVLLLAALQDIPRDLTEAATVDGAGPFNRLRFVILPHLRPVLSMVITLQLISTLRIFSQVYVMTNGGPAGASSSPIYYIYSVAIVRNLYGYASALAISLFVVILLATIVQRFLIREKT
ncbi:MAG: sugar ABC transporter permease [Rhodobacteraceae bacterium]|nr:sugar ABC transporter permease [Paracoccaceae bacterium]MCY4141327.1 sugar ABC transporter permease [Paracoccaceae bacterium]